MTAMRCKDQILHVAEVLQQDHSTHAWTVMSDKKKKIPILFKPLSFWDLF